MTALLYFLLPIFIALNRGPLSYSHCKQITACNHFSTRRSLFRTLHTPARFSNHSYCEISMMSISIDRLLKMASCPISLLYRVFALLAAATWPHDLARATPPKLKLRRNQNNSSSTAFTFTFQLACLLLCLRRGPIWLVEH